MTSGTFSRRATGRRQVGRLLDRVHDVVPPEQHARPGLEHERHVERELRERRPGRTRPTGSDRLRSWRTPGTDTGWPLRVGQQVDRVAEIAERADHGQDRERSAADLEERLRCQEEDAQGRARYS
jgi:hypothetical protein